MSTTTLDLTDPHDAYTYVCELWSAAHTARGQLRGRRGIADNLRRVAVALGHPVPFGDGDEKTGAPGTYRPVGGSCPPACPYLGNGCYAQGGNVALHQRRATSEAHDAALSAGAAMVWAVLTGRIARLHVSGDLGQTIDGEYCAMLAALADAVNVRAGRPEGTTVAWTYTHHEDGPWLRWLRSCGVAIRLSDSAGEWGAVVMPFADVTRRKVTGRDARGRFVERHRIAKCPAQLRETTCAECRLCWTRPDVAIAFDPHGGTARKAAAASPFQA